MANVTENYGGINDLTVISLNKSEADELAGLLHEYYWVTLKADQNGWPLQELYDALVPTDDEE